MGRRRPNATFWPSPKRSETTWAMRSASCSSRYAAVGEAVERLRAGCVGACRVDGNAYRGVYTVRFAEAVYVLHAFQKKSPSGIRTSRTDVELVEERLKRAQRDYEEHHGKAKR